jgi:thioredoxin
MKHIFVLGISSMLVLASCGSNTNTGAGMVSGDAEMFDSLITALNDEQIVDVRTPEEFAEGHLKGAQNIDWQNGDFAINVGALDKSRPVLVYCHSGNRSKQAADYLFNNGFTTVYELDGGFSSWQSAGKPTVKEDEGAALENGVSLEQYNKFLADNKVVLIDFTATWCGPCKMLAPSLHELADEYPEKFKLLKVDVDRDRPVAEYMNIAAMPTLVLYKDGQIQWRNEGLVDKQLILDKINSVQ